MHASDVAIKDSSSWEYLSRFIGYGPVDPRFVFIGLEERARGGDDEARNVDARIAHPEVFGADRAHRDAALGILYPTLRAAEIPQWVIAAVLATKIRQELGEDIPPCPMDSLDECFLAELLPVPRRSSRSKSRNGKDEAKPSYPLQRFGLRSETTYFQEALGRSAGGTNRHGVRDTPRWLALRSLVAGRPKIPDFIVCYGKSTLRVFDQLIGPLRSSVTVMDRCVLRIGVTGRGSVAIVTGFFTWEANPNTADVSLADCKSVARHLVSVWHDHEALIKSSRDPI